MMDTVYLWRAKHTAPGCEGRTIRATSTSSPPHIALPRRYDPATGDLIVHDLADRLWDHWDLIGTLDGAVVNIQDDGDAVERPDGVILTAREILDAGAYEQA